jgi:hypothetical protein
VLALPDLEQAKTAVLNSLTSASGQRTYDHAIREFVAWYCSEPRLAFNRTSSSVIGSTSNNANTPLLLSIFGWQPSAVSRTKQLTPVCSVQNWPPAFAVSKACGTWAFGLGTG